MKMVDNIGARILDIVNNDPEIPSWAANYFCEMVESEIEAMENLTNQDIQDAFADIKGVFEEATITIYPDYDSPYSDAKCFVVERATFEDMYGHSFDLDLYDVGEQHLLEDNDDETLETSIRESLGIGTGITHIVIGN